MGGKVPKQSESKTKPHEKAILICIRVSNIHIEVDEFNSDKLIIGKGGKAIFSGEDFFPFGKRTEGMRNLKQSSRS